MKISYIPQNPKIIELIASEAEEELKTRIQNSEDIKLGTTGSSNIKLGTYGSSDKKKKKKNKSTVPFYGEAGSILSLSYSTCYRGYMRPNTTLKNSFSGDVSCSDKSINFKIYNKKIHMTGIQKIESGFEVSQILVTELRKCQTVLNLIHAKLSINPQYLVNLMNFLLKEVKSEKQIVAPSKLLWYRYFDIQGYRIELLNPTEDQGSVVDFLIRHEKFCRKKYYAIEGVENDEIIPEGVEIIYPKENQLKRKKNSTPIKSFGVFSAWALDEEKIRAIAETEEDFSVLLFLCQDLPGIRSYIRYMQLLSTINTIIYTKDIFIIKDRDTIPYPLSPEEKEINLIHPYVLKWIIIMANKNFNLGFKIDKDKLIQILPKYGNFIIKNAKKNNCEVSFPYNDTDRVSLLKNKKKITHHKFTINRAGTISQNGPGKKLMDEAFLLILSKLTSLRSHIEE